MEYADKKWVEGTWNGIVNKTVRNAKKYGVSFPEVAVNGEFKMSKGIECWTNGFWPGILWLVYGVTGNKCLRDIAEGCEKMLEEVLKTPEVLGHDVGFMWTLSSVADYKLTGNENAKKCGLRAALCLAARFNPAGNFIRSWDEVPGKDTRGWSIADNMMNLPLIYWASELTEDPRFSQIAQKHTDTMINYLIRPDGSSNHIIKFDIYTGEYCENRQECLDYTQGMDLNSSWTRGQAWVIYGLTLGYRYTKKTEYLNAAKRCAHYFISALGEKYVPPIDFRGEPDNKGTDSSAGAIAACGLLEIANNVSEYEKNLYLNAAIKILKDLQKYCYADMEQFDNLLEHAASDYHAKTTRDVGLIYGDYFYTEAIYRLLGNNVIFW